MQKIGENSVGKLSEFENTGSKLSEQVGTMVLDKLKENPAFAENFKEDVSMDNNSSDLTTTVLAKAIYYKAYDDFAKYFDLVWNLTPADLGMPEGAGVYQIPIIDGAIAVQLDEGQPVAYTNDKSRNITLTTATYGIGTRINRRILKRGAVGMVEKFMQAASDAVMRKMVSDIVNGLAAGADAGNIVTGGITYTAVHDAKRLIKNATNAYNVKFGFEPNAIVVSADGEYTLKISTDFKNVVINGQRNVPGKEVPSDYEVVFGLRWYYTALLDTTLGAKSTEAIVLDTNHSAAFLKETDMEVFDGRIPGTAGDVEIIHAVDYGMVIRSTKAIAPITAA